MICIVIAQYFMFLLLSTAAASALSSAASSKYQQETEDGVRFDLINLFIFMCFFFFVVFHYHKAPVG